DRNPECARYLPSRNPVAGLSLVGCPGGPMQHEPHDCSNGGKPGSRLIPCCSMTGASRNQSTAHKSGRGANSRGVPAPVSSRMINPRLPANVTGHVYLRMLT